MYANLHLQAAQLGQLRVLNHTLWAQQAEEQRQRYLSDLLVQIMQGAERIQTAAGKDIFAAGILAHRWLQTTHWIQTTHFSDFERKRAWEHCRGVLLAARDRLWADANAAQKANAYLRLEDRIVELQAMLGPDPRGNVNRWIVEQRRLDGWSKVWAIVTLVGAGLGGLLSLPALLSDERGVILLMIWMLMGPIAFVGTLKWFTTRPLAQRAAAGARHMSTCFVEMESLHRDEHGVRFLERTRAEHPLLTHVPAAEPVQPAQPAPMLEKQTIERQVVVGRCKYCAALTPVDLSRCQNCGADKPF